MGFWKPFIMLYTVAMNIGVISYDYSPPIGGLGIVAQSYVRELRRLCNDDVITIISPSSSSFEYVSFLALKRYRKPGGCPLFSALLSLSLQRIVRKYSLDILHVHAGSGGVFLLRKPSIPLIVTSHHTYKQEATHVFRNQPLRRFWKLFMSLLERRTYRFADHITCVSQDTADALVSDYGIDVSKITIIENGIDDAYFNTSEVRRDAKTVLFVGRLEERKGIWTLLQAFLKVYEARRDARLELIGSNLLGSALETFLKEHSLLDAVTLRGYTEERQRIHFMQKATMVVVPSILEGFGLIAGEAMALGCPLIASSAPGLRSIVEDRKTGLLVPPQNIDCLVDAILRLFDDEELRLRLGSVAAKVARDRFRQARAGIQLSRVLDKFRTNNVYKS